MQFPLGAVSFVLSQYRPGGQVVQSSSAARLILEPYLPAGQANGLDPVLSGQ